MFIVGNAAAGYQFRHVVVAIWFGSLASVLRLRLLLCLLALMLLLAQLIRLVVALDNSPANRIHGFDNFESRRGPEEKHVVFNIVPDEISVA